MLPEHVVAEEVAAVQGRFGPDRADVAADDRAALAVAVLGDRQDQPVRSQPAAARSSAGPP